MRRYFASDNAATIHPRVLAAIEEANRGHALAYGEDPWTGRAVDTLRGHFGDHAEVLLVFGGTGANVVALRSAIDSYQAVLCADIAHLYVDECAAPERFLGAKLLPLPTTDGRIAPESLDRAIWKGKDVHYAPPRVLSLTQPTERGTLYQPEQLHELADLAHRSGLLVHVDCARLPNAAAALNLDLGAMLGNGDVDLLSLGGTKCGLLGGEAVVILRPELTEAAPYYRMQCTQLPSKMRFVAAQMEALYSGDLWRELAGHANAMAARLAQLVAGSGAIEPIHPVETNALFACLPERAIQELQEEFVFARWPGRAGLVRWMTAWDTSEEDVVAFGEAVRSVL